MYEIVEILKVFTYFLVVYILVLVLHYLNKYYKAYTYNKRLTFTRDSIKDLKSEIRDVLIDAEKHYHEEQEHRNLKQEHGNLKQEHRNLMDVSAPMILSLYNEFAVGVNEGLYDELYVKTVIGREMRYYYKMYYKNTIDINEYDNYLIPLALLLKRWEGDDAPVYVEKVGGK